MDNSLKHSLVPSKEKYGCFRHAVNFCEQLVIKGNFFMMYPENSDCSALLDCLKVKLFSPEKKGGGIGVHLL
jgi:hypothetical protein